MHFDGVPTAEVWDGILKPPLASSQGLGEFVLELSRADYVLQSPVNEPWITTTLTRLIEQEGGIVACRRSLEALLAKHFAKKDDKSSKKDNPQAWGPADKDEKPTPQELKRFQIPPDAVAGFAAKVAVDDVLIGVSGKGDHLRDWGMSKDKGKSFFYLSSKPSFPSMYDDLDAIDKATVDAALSTNQKWTNGVDGRTTFYKAVAGRATSSSYKVLISSVRTALEEFSGTEKVSSGSSQSDCSRSEDSDAMDVDFDGKLYAENFCALFSASGTTHAMSLEVLLL